MGWGYLTITSLDLYGTKEEIDDAEDFYPYAFVKFNV